MSTIHEQLPSGFHFADRLQVQQYQATGSVNGASKVCLVQGDRQLVDDEADILQAGGPDEYPRGYYEHLAAHRMARLAVRLRPPFRPEHILNRPLIQIDLQNRHPEDVAPVVHWYRRQYNAGWAAGKRGSGMDRSDTTHAWDDGYLDAAAGRPKWHFSWCLDHDECGEA